MKNMCIGSESRISKKTTKRNYTNIPFIVKKIIYICIRSNDIKKKTEETRIQGL